MPVRNPADRCWSRQATIVWFSCTLTPVVVPSNPRGERFPRLPHNDDEIARRLARSRASDRKAGTVSERGQERVAPYMAVGLSTVVHGIGSRRDIERNLQIVEDGIHAAVS